MTAHPRRCGADRHPLPRQIRRERLIPAGAGQTRRTTAPCPRCAAHPRRCGADRSGMLFWVASSGSSPQVRGRLGQADEIRRANGLIPAGAGQTHSTMQRSPSGPAHPRRCGADRFRLGLGLRSWGSSPQVRGRPQRGPLSWFTHSAHPRRCGADTSIHTPRSRRPGSSPQVRGRQGFHLGGQHLPGLIPAGAGQTPTAGNQPRADRAHPRRCGADDLL